MQKWLLGIVMVLGFAGKMLAQVQDAEYDAKVKVYIDKYKALAIAEQKRGGIPASIILAQGIHETQAGCSELATQANNHFGIKCKKEWTGLTFAHTDDAPDECFRKYSRSEDSYKDHTDYLVKTPRYASLFKLSVTDYPSWALGLKKCGYATNPRYAQILIKLVEDYRLQEYTYAALNNAEIIPDHDPVIVEKPKNKPEATEAPAIVAAAMPDVHPATTQPVVVETPPAVTAPPATQANGNIQVSESASATSQPEPKRIYGKEVTVNGLRAIYGHKGETPLGYAYNAGIRYSKLLDFNEIDERPLPYDMYLYLERKNAKGVRSSHTVREGETLFFIAQEEGIQIKDLMDMNLLTQGEEPAPGTVLQLQGVAEIKPELLAVRKQPAQPGHAVTVEKPAYASSHQATKPARVSRIKVSNNEKPVEPVGSAGPAAPASTVSAPPVENVKAIDEPAQPVASPSTTPQPNAAAGTDPTKEEGNNGYPRVAESRYAVGETVAKADLKQATAMPDPVASEAPEAASAPVKPKEEPAPAGPSNETILPVTEPLAKIDASPVKEKPTQAVAIAPKTVAVPATEEEPVDDLDKLKRKFDRVVYANEEKIAAANPTMPVATEPTSVSEAPKTEVPVTEQPKPEAHIAKGEEGKYYTVKKGDTGFLIARKNNITLSQLMKMNNLDFKNAKIEEGQKLRVKP